MQDFFLDKKEVALDMVISDIIRQSKETNVALIDLPGIEQIALEKTSSQSLFKNVETQIINMAQGQQLTFEVEKKEIIACLVLSGAVVISPWLCRLKTWDYMIINHNVPEEKAADIPARAIQATKLLLIITTY